ncbi:MAG: hypothetical protein HY200_02945 [Nitrospirae bacterium]|nr:hypothetical protein [Nitrospirota bacterium]
MKYLHIPLIIWILPLVLVLSCGSKNDSASCLSGATIVSVTVSPSNYTFSPPPYSKAFTAEARDLNGNTVCGVTFAWTNTTGTMSCVDQNGLVTLSYNRFSPTDTITASVGSFSGPATVTYPMGLPPPPPGQGC